MMKTNFHTHTARCGHASGRDEEYVQSAIRGGYQVLGFADHSPWRFASSYRSHMRMNPQEQFQDYLRSIRSLRRNTRIRLISASGWNVNISRRIWIGCAG